MNRLEMRTKEKYSAQMHAAKARGIEWGFTYDEWCDVWEKSGKWDSRGITADGYVMGRIGDIGGYDKENVMIIRHVQNVIDARCYKSWSVLISKERKTKRFYVYNGEVFEKISEIAASVGISERTVNKWIASGVVERYKRVDAYRLYVTPAGSFRKPSDAVEAVRVLLGRDITRQTLWHRYRNDIFPDYYIEDVPDSVIKE